MDKSTRSSPQSAPIASPLKDREVASYLRRLIAFLVLGLVVMATAAIWAWSRYGPKSGAANPDRPRPTWVR
jgi:hypothetical protein